MQEMNVSLMEDSDHKARKVTELGSYVENIDTRLTDFSGVVNKRLEQCAPRIEIERVKFDLKSYATLEDF